MDATEQFLPICGGVSILSNNCTLYWFHRLISFLIADRLYCCIAKRCATSNCRFKDLAKYPYRGPELTGASNNPLNAEFVIRLTLEVGIPVLKMEVEFVVVEDLPYLCIAGN